MGAHIREIDGVRGVQFVLWAPNAKAVCVVSEILLLFFKAVMQHRTRLFGQRQKNSSVLYFNLFAVLGEAPTAASEFQAHTRLVVRHA